MKTPVEEIIVIKQNLQEEETWRYSGTVLARDNHSVLIEARFNRSDLPFHGITFRNNDRFVERYYDNRWYNIFELHDWEDDRLKGWYCNVTKPAEFAPGQIAYVDLALDLLVYPDGTYLVLDEDEFAALPLDEATQTHARQALDQLITLAQAGNLGEETTFRD